MTITIQRKNVVFTMLCIYFASKMLWDSIVPFFFEWISLVVVGYGVVCCFWKNRKEDLIHIVAVFLLFCIYVFVNAFWKDTAQQFGRAIYEYMFYMALVFATWHWLSRIDLLHTIRILHVFGIIISLMSWYEYLTRSYLIGSFTNVIIYLGENYGFRSAVFSRSFLSHGILLGFFALNAYYLFITTSKKRYLLTTAFCFLSILTTSSRGPLAATLAGVIIEYIMNRYRMAKRPNARASTWLFIAAMAVFLFWLMTSSFTTGNPTIDYFFYRIRKTIDWSGDAGNVGRISLWKRSIMLFCSSPMTGIGPSKTGSWGSGSLGVTESGILKHLCELGIIGFALYYFFILLIIGKGIKFYRLADKDRKCDMILFFGIITMVLVNNCVLQSTEEIVVSFIFWFGMGGLLAQKSSGLFVK